MLEGGYRINGGIVSAFGRSVAGHVRALVDGCESRQVLSGFALALWLALWLALACVDFCLVWVGLVLHWLWFGLLWFAFGPGVTGHVRALGASGRPRVPAGVFRLWFGLTWFGLV